MMGARWCRDTSRPRCSRSRRRWRWSSRNLLPKSNPRCPRDQIRAEMRRGSNSWTCRLDGVGARTAGQGEPLFDISTSYRREIHRIRAASLTVENGDMEQLAQNPRPVAELVDECHERAIPPISI